MSIILTISCILKFELIVSVIITIALFVSDVFWELDVESIFSSSYEYIVVYILIFVFAFPCWIILFLAKIIKEKRTKKKYRTCKMKNFESKILEQDKKIKDLEIKLKELENKLQ